MKKIVLFQCCFTQFLDTSLIADM